MERRTIRRKEKHVRRRRRYRQRLGSMFLVLFFTIILIGASRGIQLKAASQHTETERSIPISGAENPSLDNQPDTGAANTNSPWYLMLVNRQNAVPENYDVDLAEVAGGEQVDRRIYEPLMDMLEAAKESNWGQLPRVVSGYRTQEEQKRLYDDKIAKYLDEGYSQDDAEEMAKQWVAVPGHSEHQLGFAVDINGATYDVYFWLQENSYKYGFIFRYPGDKTEITGTAEEVWHYRYVGVEAAAEIYEQGLCLEEYLENLEADNSGLS